MDIFFESEYLENLSSRIESFDKSLNYMKEQLTDFSGNEEITNVSQSQKEDDEKLSLNTLQYNQEKELGIIENNQKIKFNKFIEDYNNKESQSSIESRIKKIREESEKIQLLMKLDLKKQIDKKNNEINNKEKVEEQKREEWKFK